MIAAADQTDRDRGAKNRATLKWLVLVAVATVYLVILPAYFADQRYVLRVITTASVLSLISLGVWLTFTIGRINIGQGAFALIGGYTTAILATKLGISFWISLPLSGLVAPWSFVLGFHRPHGLVAVWSRCLHHGGHRWHCRRRSRAPTPGRFRAGS